MASGKTKYVIRAEDREEQGPFHHPHNPHCEMFGTSLGDVAGLTRLGVHVVRLPPGKEAAAYHTHQVEDEFYFVISGRGVARIDGEEHPIGPGDFVGLPAPSPPHQLKNPGTEDLVYLVGGERRPVEFAELPEAGKHVIRAGGRAWAVSSDALEPFWRKSDGED